MIRIGIIGTENTHAMAFAKYFNQTAPYDNIRVTALVGDAVSNAAIQSAVDVEISTDNPEDLLGNVDAVMITSRRGSTHFEIAMPFIEAGLPLFIDKPFTSNTLQAQKLMRLAEKNNCLIMGGSGCKYAPEIPKLEQICREQDYVSASMAFTIMESPYDGFWFYASHLVEMALTVFGYVPEKVSARFFGAGLTAVLYYGDHAVALHFVQGVPDGSCVLYTKQGTYFESIDFSYIYEKEAELFASMLLGFAKPLTFEQLVNPIVVIDGILHSAKANGEEVGFNFER